MNIALPRLTSRLILPLLAVAVLGGCAVVPYDDGYYNRSYSSSVYVAPTPVYVGGTYYGGSYYRPAPRYVPRNAYPPPRHVHPRPYPRPPHVHPRPHPRPPGFPR